MAGSGGHGKALKNFINLITNKMKELLIYLSVLFSMAIGLIALCLIGLWPVALVGIFFIIFILSKLR